MRPTSRRPAQGTLPPMPSRQQVEKAKILHGAKIIAMQRKAEQNYKDAVGAWEAVLQLDPVDVFAWCELGTCWMNLNQLDAARACFKQARRVKPSYVPPMIALADLETYAKPSRPHKALALLELAATKLHANDPNAVPYHVARANAYAELKRYDEAERAAWRAIQIRQDWPPAWSVLGNTLTDQGKFEAAMPVNKKAWEMTGDTRLAMNYALACLASGHWQEGWDAYGERLKDPNHEGYRRFAPIPYWDGQAMEGDLLVFCEQGLGDFIQFSRYLKFLRDKVRGRVILELWPTQMSLAEAMALPVDEIVAIPEIGKPKVHFDRWMALISAVKYSGLLSLDEVPPAIPLNLPPTTREEKKQAAIIWYGNPEFGGADRRDIPLELLKPVIESRPDLTWWCPSPEKRAEADVKRTALPIHIIKGSLRESAARLHDSTLLVSCDTGPAHLAGTMGVPVHLLIPNIWDWRWGKGDTTTWYPSMRLWRQHHFRDWKGIIGELAATLALGTTLR